MRLTVFGAVHLGYVVVETEQFADWRRFGADAIGMHVDDSLTPTSCGSGSTTGECRFLFQRGPAEDLIASAGRSTTTTPSTTSSAGSPDTASRSPRARPRRRRCAV